MKFPSRASWIDICKGIGIILVIYGHALSSEQYRFLIYAFHMPLFFFLSGLTFNYVKYQHNIHLLLKRSSKSILLPYVLFALLSYFIWILENGTSFGGFLYHLSGIVYGNSSSLFFNIVLWFLPCLFITKITFALMAKFIQKKRFILPLLFAFSLIGYGISNLPYDMHLPFGIETLFTAVVFFGLGSIWMKEYHKQVSPRLKKYAAPLLISAVSVGVVLASINYTLYNHQVDLRMNHLGNYFFFYIAAFSGILATIIISKLIRTNFLLEYVGKYSLILFALHPLVFPFLTQLMTLVITKQTLDKLHDLYFSPLYTVFSISMILFIAFAFKKLPKPSLFPYSSKNSSEK